MDKAINPGVSNQFFTPLIAFLCASLYLGKTL